uniref:Uncharacterized protein n=1 Tax=Physcomitrium patens TaxID=3218 RepID=A0A2K1L7J7_PHYPA|nr:hypothetical protein PHYPA_000398 [Physcomitrium patens]
MFCFCLDGSALCQFNLKCTNGNGMPFYMDSLAKNFVEMVNLLGRQSHSHRLYCGE